MHVCWQPHRLGLTPPPACVRFNLLVCMHCASLVGARPSWQACRAGGRPVVTDLLICAALLQAGTSAPDVWLQLLDRCAAEPSCQSAVLHSLATQLAQQRQQLSDQQQQLAGLQQQLVAAQQATAEVIAGLQVQLQQVLQRLPL